MERTAEHLLARLSWKCSEAIREDTVNLHRASTRRGWQGMRMQRLPQVRVLSSFQMRARPSPSCCRLQGVSHQRKGSWCAHAINAAVNDRLNACRDASPAHVTPACCMTPHTVPEREEKKVAARPLHTASRMCGKTRDNRIASCCSCERAPVFTASIAYHTMGGRSGRTPRNMSPGLCSLPRMHSLDGCRG